MTEYTHFTDTPSMQVMATKSRDSTLPGHELSQIHHKMGEFLGQHIIGLIGLEDIEFQHVQGITPHDGLQISGIEDLAYMIRVVIFQLFPNLLV